MIHKTNICIRQVFIFKENFILGVVCQDSYTNGHFLKVSLLATFWIVDVGESTFSLAGPPSVEKNLAVRLKILPLTYL